MSKQKANLGKKVGSNLYLHVSSIKCASPDLQSKVNQASQIANLEPAKDFNVVKVSDNRKDLSLLDYPNFFGEAFPVLNRYWSFDLDQETFRFRTYKESFNPPILHRKELLLDPKHPDRDRFAQITKEAEAIGLFDDASRIGFIQDWDALLKNRGYQVVGQKLVPVGNAEAFETEIQRDLSDTIIQRHLTALSRANLSAPMQTLARFGYLDGSKTIFDYGCGRGSDVIFLTENNIQATGWDPHYAPHNPKHTADIVNLGFVINVIEDRRERNEALRGAFELANEWLIVSVMLEHCNSGNGKPYADGVLTSRNTFQKYYSQGELGNYLEALLGIEPVPIAPGIFYVFKSSDAEQRFSTQRVAKRRSPIRRVSMPLSAEDRAARAARRLEKKYDENAELLERLWGIWLDLGREPKPKEVGFLGDIRSQVGSFPSALKLILHKKGEAGSSELVIARQNKIDDLTVYFAKLRFSGKRPPRPLAPTIREDVKNFFGNLENAMTHGEELLLKVLDKEAINAACESAAELGLGWLNEGHSLQLHTSLVSQLPPILRTYVHCATSLYGDITSTDLVKIHIRSGKLTLMEFDDFEGKPLPRMLERIKIDLMSQRLHFFDYGDSYRPPFLYLKSRFINESCPNYSKQLVFDEELLKVPFLNLENYGPPPEKFVKTLIQYRYQVDGFELKRSQSIPNLDEACGENFTYRDFIQCGETQKKTGIENLPKEPDTYTALLDLSVHLLDPIIEYFGMIKLTYGFSSPELIKKIPRGIAPRLDQHASHEKNRKGNYICSRLGSAVDFIVEDENMTLVKDWILKNLNFDRLYFYSDSLPIHISYSHQYTNKKALVVTRKKSSIARC